MWTRSLTRCFAFPILFILVASPTLGLAPPAALAAPGERCSAAHWLALSTATDPAGQPVCPPVTGWAASRLFGPDAPFTGPLFCRYDRTSDTHFAVLTEVPELHASVPRCGVVLPLRTQQGAALALDPELLYRELRFQVGATDLPLDPAQLPGVRLAVIDTQPTGSGVPPAPGQGSPHGFDVALIAHDLTCGAGCDGPRSRVRPCAAEITTQLALSLPRAGGEPSASGGFLGRPSDLALAIVREVDAWLAARQSSPPSEPPHLILNLSVGWDPELLHQVSGSALNAEELAVYAALDYAHVQGALPIAASGNSPGGSQPGQGATAPARWFAAPPATGGLFTPAMDPVVWAVGAVDRDDRPLANVRAYSLPQLVAYGDHAVAPLPAPGTGWTDPLTGSSVAAVVASSIAAVVWHLRPELGADEIVTLLARSGRELQRAAELYRPGSALGLLARQAGTSAGIGLQAPPSIRLWFNSALSRAWSREKLYGAESTWSTTMATSVDCSAAGQLSSCAEPYWVCPGSPQTGSPLPACPQSLPSIASVPWVLPQPGQDPCPTCAISSSTPPPARIAVGSSGSSSGAAPAVTWSFRLVIPSNWADGCLTDAVVELTVPGSSNTKYLLLLPNRTSTLPNGEICPGGSLLVTGLPDPIQAPATISFRIEGTSNSVRSPLYVGWPQ